MYKLVTKLVELGATAIEYILSSLLGIVFIIPVTFLLILTALVLVVIFIVWFPIALMWGLFKCIWTGKSCHGLDISISKENKNAKDG